MDKGRKDCNFNIVIFSFFIIGLIAFTGRLSGEMRQS